MISQLWEVWKTMVDFIPQLILLVLFSPVVIFFQIITNKKIPFVFQFFLDEISMFCLLLVTLWLVKIAIEHGHRNSGFSPFFTWWFSIAMLNYQRVNPYFAWPNPLFLLAQSHVFFLSRGTGGGHVELGRRAQRWCSDFPTGTSTWAIYGNLIDFDVKSIYCIYLIT